MEIGTGLPLCRPVFSSLRKDLWSHAFDRMAQPASFVLNGAQIALKGLQRALPGNIYSLDFMFLSGMLPQFLQCRNPMLLAFLFDREENGVNGFVSLPAWPYVTNQK